MWAGCRDERDGEGGGRRGNCRTTSDLRGAEQSPARRQEPAASSALGRPTKGLFRPQEADHTPLLLLRHRKDGCGLIKTYQELKDNAVFVNTLVLFPKIPLL